MKDNRYELRARREFWDNFAVSHKHTGCVRGYRDLELFFVKNFATSGPVLDAGCGMGDVLQQFSKSTQRLIIGLDFASKMLEFCSQKGLIAVQGDLCNLPFPDGVFDTSYAVRSFKNILNRGQQLEAIKEAARVTRRRLIVVDSIVETGVQGPDFNLYLNEYDLLSVLASMGFTPRLICYLPSPSAVPLISQRLPTVGHDEGFFVFDRTGYADNLWARRLYQWYLFRLELMIALVPQSVKVKSRAILLLRRLKKIFKSLADRPRM